MLQPDSSPISHEQLAAEVKGIYAGLVMVEAKCIALDSIQATDPSPSLAPEAWQALVALHRTFLFEHHDFLMASQHPSATHSARNLAMEYSMPVRLWKHGIHAFLEILRHRLPESQDYMLAFIYLAYQVMAGLMETVPSFADTWAECLGDLARYRMAIEEDQQAMSDWAAVAARWYAVASEQCAQRLYHHLGVLERPGLRKVPLYARSLPISEPRTSTCPLAEDHLIRGFVWTQGYFPPDWFDGHCDDDPETDGNTSTPEVRTERLLWLMVSPAIHTDDCCHDVRSQPRNPRVTQAHFTALRLRSRANRPTGVCKALQLLAVMSTLRCAYAAPLPVDLPTSHPSGSIQATMNDWSGSFAEAALLSATLTTTLAAVGNTVYNLKREIIPEPGLSGDYLVCVPVVLWATALTAPGETRLISTIGALWFAAASDYVSKMCRLLENGRLYFYSSIGLGFGVATLLEVIAAMNQVNTPTLASMVQDGLPLAVILISATARLLHLIMKRAQSLSKAEGPWPHCTVDAANT